MPRPRTRFLHSLVATALFLLLVPRLADAQSREYLAKPARYLFLDALILTSPVTGFLALLFWSDPRWRERPSEWWKSAFLRRERRRWLVKHAIWLAAVSILAASGAAVLAVHVAGYV
jgi:hypothetical protein